jgi:pSer/pThr/pTyr-binding forkhead associated (FHA) protein
MQPGDKDRETVTLIFDPRPEDPAAPVLVGKGSGPLLPPGAIRFVIPSSGREVRVPMQDQIRIGRADAQRDIHPELDLTGDSRHEAVISRLHAMVLNTAQGVAIMDLSSVNGTQVNGYRLPPHLPYALKNGDELKFGDLIVHVFFED